MARQKNEEVNRLIQQGMSRRQAYRHMAQLEEVGTIEPSKPGTIGTNAPKNADLGTIGGKNRGTIAQSGTIEHGTIETEVVDSLTGEVLTVPHPPMPPFTALKPDGRFEKDRKSVGRGVPVNGMVLVNKIMKTEGTKFIAFEDFMVSESEFKARLEWTCEHFLQGWACKWCLGAEVRHELTTEPNVKRLRGIREKAEVALVKKDGPLVQVNGEVWTDATGRAFPVYRRGKDKAA